MSTTTTPPSPNLIRIGTRRSALALKQTDLVMAALQAAHPTLQFTVRAIATAGDRDKTTPLPELGKGLWTSELEALLTAGEIDVIVHSLKDMPTTLPAGCVLGCVTAREDPRDVVVFRAGHGGKYGTIAALPKGSVVGTSSVRRAAQLKRRYPGLVFRDVRGNIDTRVRKCDEEGYDCIILAAAGLLRTGVGHRIAQYLDSTTEGGGMLHAVGQGALGLECREEDERVRGILKAVEDTPTMMACFAERSVMRALEGGCSVPVAVETEWVEEEGEEEGARRRKLKLKALVVSLDGSEAIEGEKTEEVASLAQADAFGKKLAQELVERGAQRILDAINQVRADGATVKVGDA
ncbi:porphobilinogen deaminase, dipyromethane cofactor binding domain-containing protein [Podospora conica]|nr:porphobilinogen deaminase, dipyromethane cofactor binding domain-containing protein [Schizothecium conicum]